MKKIIIAILILPIHCFASYGIISDIHAGKEKIRKNNAQDVVYPNKAEGQFKSALKKMKGLGLDFVLVLGDNTNDDSSKYSKEVKKIADKSGIKVIFAKGNHDGKAFKYISGQNYYIRDIGGIRIIVLDTAEKLATSTGNLDLVQLQWLKSVIQDNSIVIQHHPVFDRNMNVLPQYKEEYELINANHSKAYFGHWHTSWKKDNYQGVPALTSGGFIIN